MADRPFVDPSIEPSTNALETVLAGAWPACRALLDAAASFAREWTFAKGSGWVLKVHDRRKALLYVIPLDGAFRVSLAIRERERTALLEAAAVAPLHAELAGARLYPEGYALRLDIDARSDAAPLLSLVTALVELRRPAAVPAS